MGRILGAIRTERLQKEKVAHETLSWPALLPSLPIVGLTDLRLACSNLTSSITTTQI
jgi:hypothetical protein